MVQEALVADLKMKYHKKEAHKVATRLYSREKEKNAMGEAGMSSKSVREEILEIYKCAPSSRTIERYMYDNMAGCSPVKMGEKGSVPEMVFKTLCTTFETMVRINQLNGREVDNTQKKADHACQCMHA